MTSIPITQPALEAVHDDATLFAFLHDYLGWATDPTDTFTYAGPPVDDIGVDVRQLVPFSGTDPFVIMLVKFHSDFKRGALRDLMIKIRQRIRTAASYNGKTPEDFVFLCVNPGYAAVRFAHFRTQDARQPRLSVFGWERARISETRTLCEVNLPALYLQRNLLGELDWNQTTVDKWHSAWDVEQVTDKFFREYHATFSAITAIIGAASPGVTPDHLHTFTLTLMNRMLFCWFIQEKGWLAHDHQYLTGQYVQAGITDAPVHLHAETFYHDFLRPLFLHLLNTRHADRDAQLVAHMGEIPYLNGGLFEENPLDRGEQGVFHVPNETMRLLLSTRLDAAARPYGLFQRWNFTVQESTPLDIEVAVDPEMLGKVFEELMNEQSGAGGDTKRHETGAYYTPRPIVSFMCKEALKGILGEDSSITHLVDDYDASSINVPAARALLSRIAALKIVDPACGSGAYLMGMLHELHALTRLLDTRVAALTARDDYRRKLDIISSNLYGVDLNASAVEIARLRLWLSLAVDYDDGGDISSIPALPNLTFKIETGDSLTAPNPAAGFETDLFRQQQIAEFDEKKCNYADPDYPGDKQTLLTEILTLKAEIAAWTHPGQQIQGFDWRVDFAEVFTATPANNVNNPIVNPVNPVNPVPNAHPATAEPTRVNPVNEVNPVPNTHPTTHPAAVVGGGPVRRSQDGEGGFDIVLANPPYVRQELIKDLKPALKQVYGDLFCGTADLYVFFYYRALQLLRPGGMLAFISSNKWLRAGYGANLRAHLATTTGVRHIIDFGDLPVFQSATTYPMIIVTQNGALVTATAPATFTQVKSLDDPYPDVRVLVDINGVTLPADALDGDTWRLVENSTATYLRQMAVDSIPLGEYVEGKIYRGVLTGYNAAFVINAATRDALIAADAHSIEIIKHLVVGKDIRKWHICNCDDGNTHYKGKWLIFTRRGIDINEYPAVKNHLNNWRTSLEAKPKDWDNNNKWPGRKSGRYKWYEIQDDIAYYGEFDKPKIVYPDISSESRFAFDTSGAYLGNTAYIIPSSDLYLLGVLNSQAVLDYYIEVSSQVRGGYLRFFSQYVEQIPIPNASPADRAAIAALVQQCLHTRGTACTAQEEEINARVARLYGV